jgi:hypothetical protein
VKVFQGYFIHDDDDADADDGKVMKLIFSEIRY